MNAEDKAGEQGFLLLGLIVAIFLILLALSVAAPKMARELRREREVETVRRGNQYVRAIQLYYRKFGHYPGSMDQLEKTNNIRFLRQDYVDPMTGKVDWRIIKVGENKTTVKGFFGKPLAGIESSGLGSASGMASSFGSPGTAAGGSSLGNSGGLGSSQGSSFGSSFGSGGLSSGGLGSGSSNTSGAAGSSTTGSSASTNGFPSTSASDFTGSEGPVMGVGLVKEGDSIITLNGQTTYNTWEFIYDPRIEQLKAKSALLGGAGSTSAAGFGSGSASSFGSGSGSSSGSGFGSGSSSFGSSGSSGFGSSSPSSGTGSNAPNLNSNPQ